MVNVGACCVSSIKGVDVIKWDKLINRFHLDLTELQEQDKPVVFFLTDDVTEAIYCHLSRSVITMIRYQSLKISRWKIISWSGSLRWDAADLPETFRGDRLGSLEFPTVMGKLALNRPTSYKWLPQDSTYKDGKIGLDRLWCSPFLSQTNYFLHL